MPAGIQIYNSAGTIQIDDSDPALALREKRTVSVPAATLNNMIYVDVTFTNVEFPMMAVRTGNTGSYVSVVTASRTGSSITYRIGQTGASPLNVVCYFFDRPIPTSTSSGLKIYDTTGKCTFDSNHKHGVIRREVTVSTGTLGSTTTVTKPSGETWAALFLRTSYGRELRDGGQITLNEWWWEEYFYQSGVCFNTSAQILVSRWTQRESLLYTNNYQAPLEQYMDGEAKCLFLDVTGY